MDEQKTVGARVCHDRDQDITQEIETPLMFNTVRYDTDNIYDKENDTRLTCKTSGIYLIMAQCIWVTETGGMFQLTIKLNGDKIIATGRDQGLQWYNPWTACSTLWKLEKGDYVEAIVFRWAEEGKDSSTAIKRAEHWDSPEFMMHLLR